MLGSKINHPQYKINNEEANWFNTARTTCIGSSKGSIAKRSTSSLVDELSWDTEKIKRKLILSQRA